MTRRLVVVGDALLDRDLEGRVERLSPDAPVPVVDEPVERARAGGAGLAAALAARDGREVVLITALGTDEPGRRLAALLDEAAVEVVDLGLDGPTPEKIRVRSSGRSLLRMDRGSGPPPPIGSPTARTAAALRSAAAVLVSDYGRGVASAMREALPGLPQRIPVVWDPHPRGGTPAPGVRLATPNRSEAARFAPEAPGEEDLAAVAAGARTLLRRWRAAGVAVTLGPRGALLQEGDGLPLVVPAERVASGDACGAGDRFASAAAGLLADGALPSEAVAGAVTAATDFVAAGGAAGTAPDRGDPVMTAEEAVSATRARGGTVVATSGCFDLLHTGHVSTLEAAGRLGDCLVVCLNSDDSVRRLKGEGRPVVPAADRAALLRSMGCVDAVTVFDEDTPEAALERLRPDVFAKGGDYAVGDLPEARLLARWGGQAVVLPYVADRSTTRLVKEVARRGTG